MRYWALLAATAVASVAYADPPARAVPARAVDDPDKIVCHREADTGNIIQRKICLTKAQWAAQSEAARKQGQELFDKGAISSCGATVPGGCD